MSDPVSDDMVRVPRAEWDALVAARLRWEAEPIDNVIVPERWVEARTAVALAAAVLVDCTRTVPPTPPERESETCPLHGKRHCRCWRDGTGSCCSCGQAPAPADSTPPEHDGHTINVGPVKVWTCAYDVGQGLLLCTEPGQHVNPNCDWTDALTPTAHESMVDELMEAEEQRAADWHDERDEDQA